MAFVTVYAKTTGDKHRIPEHLLKVPSIAKQFNKTPRQRKADERSQTTVTEPATTTDTPAAGEPKE